ncbi:MAG TPA: hypothetical protein VF338_06205, partial [Leptolinea sp.]
LAVWDLIFLDDTMKNISPDKQTRLFENKHLQSLALVLTFGLIAAFAGRLINLQIPFIVMLLGVALVIIGLDRIWGILKKGGIHIN